MLLSDPFNFFHSLVDCSVDEEPHWGETFIIYSGDDISQSLSKFPFNLLFTRWLFSERIFWRHGFKLKFVKNWRNHSDSVIKKDSFLHQNSKPLLAISVCLSFLCDSFQFCLRLFKRLICIFKCDLLSCHSCPLLKDEVLAQHDLSFQSDWFKQKPLLLLLEFFYLSLLSQNLILLPNFMLNAAFAMLDVLFCVLNADSMDEGRSYELKVHEISHVNFF